MYFQCIIYVFLMYLGKKDVRFYQCIINVITM